MNRRDLLKLGVLGTTVALTNTYASTPSQTTAPSTNAINKVQNKKRVIIIGGGYAGLTVAKNIRLHDTTSEILVFDPKNIFASCPYSNLWFGNVKDTNYEQLIFSPLVSGAKYDYQVINDKVVSINKEKKTISTLDKEYEYSILVVATGIEYDYSTYGLDETTAKECATLYPASYTGGYEQLSLKKKIEEFKGGTFVITVPKGAYRCPPAPYERAALIASYFKEKKLNAKVVILDPREKPTTKAKGFLEAFNTLYKDYIEYLPTSNITNIDTKNKTITYDTFDIASKAFVQKKLNFDDANIIPSNKASSLITKSGLAVNSQGWARVKTPSFQSLNDENIYLVGDVVGEYPFPKSAQMAHSSGIILGEQIAKILKGQNPQFGLKLPGNICYSMVSPDTAIAVTHQAYLENGEVKVKTELFEDADNITAVSTKSWYFGITQNIFE
ncbi:FAD-dependent oxidoreductase [Arcobacter sp. FWKO B]|uniref:FAD-dependent oxidoreductase n=1 Tax=Arcobacter sp. FWKO B TaxID=2593672 RepID=UPI0018A588A8|nr:FAD-dependent oxidoreductase [Arcobacter sp. FWKO B]QOG11818.1 hypothetical protein FWKOB_03500 [Arcobacter sp. FWKO B]